MSARRVKEIARDLRLNDRQSYEVGALWRELEGLSDSEALARAHAFASRSADRLAGGAALVLAQAVLHDRYMASIESPEARASYEDSLTGIGVGGESGSGEVEAEVAEATARATELEAAGNKAAASGIRRALERHQRETSREE